MEDNKRHINTDDFFDGSLPSELNIKHINADKKKLINEPSTFETSEAIHNELEKATEISAADLVSLHLRKRSNHQEENYGSYAKPNDSTNVDWSYQSEIFDNENYFDDSLDMYEGNVSELEARETKAEREPLLAEKYGFDYDKFRQKYNLVYSDEINSYKSAGNNYSYASGHNEHKQAPHTERNNFDLNYSEMKMNLNGQKVNAVSSATINQTRVQNYRKKDKINTAEVLRAGEKYSERGKFNFNLKTDDLKSFRYSDLSRKIQSNDDLLSDLELSDSRKLNIPLIVIIVTMLCYGLVMLYSASMTRGFQESGNTADFVIRQLVFTVIGVVAMTIFSLIDVRTLDKLPIAILYYFLTLFLLLIVLVPKIGRLVNGQRRWLPIPGTGITFQPSEISKVGVIFCLAVYFGEIKRRRDRGYYISSHPHKQKWLDSFLDITFPFLIVISWCVPISFQSHMSAVGIMLFMTFIVLLLNGLPIKSWFYGSIQLLAVAVAMIVVIYAMLPFLPSNLGNKWSHLVQRINIFTDSEEATEADVYQTQQAEIAIGSGGLTGLGLGQGKQKYNYLPENHNDYIFSSIVEELGFVGGFAVVALFLILLALGLGISLRTRDRYGLTLSGGITILLVTQAILSISVNVGTFPPTGISLPFFSYGGSANLIFLSIVGILLSVSRYNKKTAEKLITDEFNRLNKEKNKQEQLKRTRSRQHSLT